MKEPMKLTPTQFATVEWHHTVEHGQPFETMLKPDYWKHVASQLRPGHEIRVVAEDGTFWARLFVRSVGRHEAKVAVIHLAEFDDADPNIEELGFYVRWRNPALKFGVFRKSDNECLQDGFAVKADAFAWAAGKEA